MGTGMRAGARERTSVHPGNLLQEMKVGGEQRKGQSRSEKSWREDVEARRTKAHQKHLLGEQAV